MSQNSRGGFETTWVVHEPGPRSELGDVCFQVSLADLAAQVRGGFDPENRHTNAVVYTDPAAARADAEARIAARRVYDAALRAAREGGVVKFDDGGCPVVVHPESSPQD